MTSIIDGIDRVLLVLCLLSACAHMSSRMSLCNEKKNVKIAALVQLERASCQHGEQGQQSDEELKGMSHNCTPLLQWNLCLRPWLHLALLLAMSFDIASPRSRSLDSLPLWHANFDPPVILAPKDRSSLLESSVLKVPLARTPDLRINI